MYCIENYIENLAKIKVILIKSVFLYSIKLKLMNEQEVKGPIFPGARFNIRFI